MVDGSSPVPGTGGSTLGRIVISALARFRDRPAVTDAMQEWSYADLADAIGRVVEVFDDLGLKRGDGFAMLVGNRAEQIACQYAAILSGIRYTALHPLASAQTHRYLLQNADIAALLVDPAILPDHIDFRACAPSLLHVLALGQYPNSINLLASMAAATPRPLVDRAEPSDVAYLFYTGGTTGVPKGVMLSHRSLVASTLSQAADWDLPANIPRFLAATPTSHASGAIATTVLLRGGYVRLVSGFDPESFCRIVAAERINFTFLVPTMLYGLLEHSASSQYDLSSLETVVYGAAPISRERLKTALTRFGPIFVQLYGQTEAPMVITTLRKSDHDLNRPELLGSAGLPGPAVEIKLLNSDFEEVAIGEPGEVCLRGPLVMDGYWKQPQLTAEVFQGGWLHTGDVATRSSDGYFTIVDRTKDLIISGGFNIYPREVEEALLSHSAVSSAAVVGITDDKWGEAVTACVVLRAGASVEAKELKAHVRAVRGAIWAPKLIVFLQKVPLTSLGKIDRKALRAIIAEHGQRFAE